MPLVNYTTTVPAARTAQELMAMLSSKGATAILLEYGPTGQHTGLKWKVTSQFGTLSFSLPINTEAVYEVLTRQRVMPNNKEARAAQAERTAWRIVKDWVRAQMALVETEMVSMEEVFMPYMLSGNRTMYQVLTEDGFSAVTGNLGNAALPGREPDRE